jgi:hypothetical protein
MTRRAEIAARLPSLAGLKLAEAAAFVGVSSGMFLKAQAEGKMPKPRDFMGMPVYDADEVWAAFKALPHHGETPPPKLRAVDGWGKDDVP